MQTIPQVVHIHAGNQKSIITDDFCRKELIDLIPEFPLLINLCHIAITGCDICSGYPKMISHTYDGHQIIILSFIQFLHIKIRSRCHNTGHFSFYDSLCRFRILYLFADGYFIPFIDQTIDICFCCVIRNPAHRSPFRKTTVFAGKCKFQFTGDSFRILKKHFIKVPKAIKKNRILIRTFCLTVMDHHR